MGVDTLSKSKCIEFGFQWIIGMLITMKIVAFSKWKLLQEQGMLVVRYMLFLNKKMQLSSTHLVGL